MTGAGGAAGQGDAAAPRQPAVPRLAATVLLLRDDPFEVLMVKRSAQGFFPSALVFPGGVVDDDDWADHWRIRADGYDDLDGQERAVRIAGLRECWEEAALLAAHGDFSVDGHAPGNTPLPRLMDQLGARFDLGEIAHFAHWVTPEQAPRRWDTHFLVARGPTGQNARCDGSETVGVEWIAPAKAIALGDAGAREVLFSTRANLLRLAQSGSVDEAIAAARVRPRFPVHPQAERRPDGIRVFIPREAGYPVSEHFIPVPSSSTQVPAPRSRPPD